MRGALAVLLVVAFTSGCVETSDDQPPTDPLVDVADDAVAQVPSAEHILLPLPAVANITLAKGQSHDLRLGVGWGRLTVTATEDFHLSPFLSHNTMEDLGTFSQDGNAIYNDPAAHTVVYAFRAGETPLGSDTWTFTWWGSPGWAGWPHDTTPTGNDGVDLQAGENATIIVANTVPGYTLHLGPAGGSALDWMLSAAHGHAAVWPDTTQDGLANGPLTVQRTTTWETQALQQPPSVIYQRMYEATEGNGARVEVTQDEMDCVSTGTTSDVIVPDAEYEYSLLGSGHSTSTGYGPTLETLDLDCFRHRTTTGANAMDQQIATGFLFVPY